MKTTQITIFFLVIIFLNSCNWFNHDKECRYYKDIVDYKVEFYQSTSDIGKATKNLPDNYRINFSELHIMISAILLILDITEECSYMRDDSIVSYITQIDIFSNTDYNQDFPANSNLNELFMTKIYENGYPIEITQTKYVIGRNFNLPSLHLFLYDKPTQTDTFSFTIHIELNDFRTFDIETNPIIIIP